MKSKWMLLISLVAFYCLPLAAFAAMLSTVDLPLWLRWVWLFPTCIGIVLWGRGVLAISLLVIDDWKMQQVRAVTEETGGDPWE